MHQYDYKNECDLFGKLMNIYRNDIEQHIPEHYTAFEANFDYTRKNTNGATINLKKFLAGFIKNIPPRNKRIKDCFRIIHKYQRKNKITINLRVIESFHELNKSFKYWLNVRKIDSKDSQRKW